MYPKSSKEVQRDPLTDCHPGLLGRVLSPFDRRDRDPDPCRRDRRLEEPAVKVTYRPIGHDWIGAKTEARRHGRFYSGSRYKGDQLIPGRKTPWSDTLALLDRELRHLGADGVIFQIDIPESMIRLDGMPRNDARPTDPAVIISFESKHGPLRYACDVFFDWRDNVRAIALGLEALRTVDRYGITHKAEQYKGFVALGMGTGVDEGVQRVFATVKEAAEFMLTRSEVAIDGNLDGLTASLVSDKNYRDFLFKRAALKLHPDAGGNNRSEWDSLVNARRILETGKI